MNSSWSSKASACWPAWPRRGATWNAPPMPTDNCSKGLEVSGPGEPRPDVADPARRIAGPARRRRDRRAAVRRIGRPQQHRADATGHGSHRAGRCDTPSRRRPSPRGRGSSRLQLSASRSATTTVARRCSRRGAGGRSPQATSRRPPTSPIRRAASASHDDPSMPASAQTAAAAVAAVARGSDADIERFASVVRQRNGIAAGRFAVIFVGAIGVDTRRTRRRRPVPHARARTGHALTPTSDAWSPASRVAP